MDILKNNLPLFIRQLLLIVGGALVAKGVITDGQLQQLLDPLSALIVGGLIVAGTAAYQFWARPSARALEVAKEVDAKVPPTSPVIIKTPQSMPDIEVAGKV